MQFQANVPLKSLIYHAYCQVQEFSLSSFILYLNFLEGERDGEIKGRLGCWKEADSCHGL